MKTTTTTRRAIDLEIERINARYREQRAAELAAISPEEHARRWAEIEERCKRQMRAHDAQRRQARSPLPAIRQNAQPPKPSIMWAKATSLDPARDQRLCPGAVRTLLVLRALVEKGETLIKAGIAALIGISARTVQRHLRQLESAGYVLTETVRNRIGSAVGLAVKLTEAVLPAFMRRNLAPQPDKQPQNGGFPAETVLSPNKLNSHIEESQPRKIDIEAALASLPPALAASLRAIRPKPAD